MLPQTQKRRTLSVRRRAMHSIGSAKDKRNFDKTKNTNKHI